MRRIPLKVLVECEICGNGFNITLGNKIRFNERIRLTCPCGQAYWLNLTTDLKTENDPIFVEVDIIQ